MQTKTDARNTYCAAITFAWEGTAGDYPADRPHYSAVIHASEDCTLVTSPSDSSMKPVLLADTHFAGNFSQWFAEMDGFDGEVVIDPVVPCGRCFDQPKAPRPTFKGGQPLAAKPTKPVTEKQLGLLKTLFAERAAVPGVPELRTAMLATYKQGELTAAQASGAISWLLDQAKPAQAATPAAPGGLQLAKGMIVKNGQGEIVRVYVSKTGGLYGKVRDDYGDWEYQAGALKGARAITAEEAKQYADDHDHCVFCGLALEDKRSTDVGYGPVCAEKYGLPWGAK